MTHRYLVAIGGNLPMDGASVGENMQSAIAEVGRRTVRIVAVSRLFRSPAFPPGSGPDFVNGAFALEDDRPPEEILSLLHDVERSHGRERRVRWGPRTLDLDLIAAGAYVVPDVATWRHWQTLPQARQSTESPASLILPHPRLQDRAFVLVPLMDIAPDWRHPVTGLTVAEMHAELTGEARGSVVPLPDPACQ
ncbi:2-amino-4-hydroxy-6-hydroxymethyldihydropteridine diphosphokinase [Pseudooceanicola batsensis]|nr:2-amino-4-hydroxy-6-hydroxymethyldihydropteridine diphosphokinase [Pseudooceanicola batsensis]